MNMPKTPFFRIQRCRKLAATAIDQRMVMHFLETHYDYNNDSPLDFYFRTLSNIASSVSPGSPKLMNYLAAFTDHRILTALRDNPECPDKLARRLQRKMFPPKRGKIGRPILPPEKAVNRRNRNYSGPRYDKPGRPRRVPDPDPAIAGDYSI